MKRANFKNEDGMTYSARIMTIDELYAAWKLYKPSTPFYTWLDMLKEANIITQRELPNPDYIVIDFSEC